MREKTPKLNRHKTNKGGFVANEKTIHSNNNPKHTIAKGGG